MNKQKVKKRKINATNVWAIIVSCITALVFIGLIVGVIVITSLLKDRPTLNLADFEQVESSVIYDNKGEEISNLGAVIRQNVDYNELPNCVVDAFVAIEDSRFFEHNGFDLPRFTKALIENIKTMSFGQGGSTFTMQLVKNTYFTNDDTGEEASRTGVSGIRRKVQEIALAFELEKYEPKQFIFESYLNKLSYGGDRNIRGIQKAAQYYFSKDVNQLNLNEAAFLAGVINAPYYYSPFTQDSDGTYHLAEAQQREEEVLYQMYNHGYISKEEYELAKTVQVKDLLTDPYASNNSGEGIPYQAYVDAVVNEVIDLTGLDPYTTTMHIYTYMNKDIQNVMDEIQAQTEEDYLEYPDDFVECASVCINNHTGQVVGILGGRNYANGGQLLLNHATEQYKQPGSSIKPILDYALAFENLGWATDHVLCDQPMYMDSSKQNLVYNFSNSYVGDVTLKQAVGQSINTCAIQALQSVLDKMKYEYVVNYTQSLGYDFTLDAFNVQYAIGGSTCEVTPYQHAAAYAAIMNYGVYNTPHTVSRIEFTNGKSPITPVYESKQVLSEQASYLTTELMKSNVQSYGGSYDVVKNDTYQVYGKTGTTDWGNSGKEFDIPSGANKDAWLVASTSEYTTATWVGYEKAVKGQPSYITNDYYYKRPQAKIAHLILDACYQYGDTKPSKIEKPSGISSITHIIGTWPYASTNIEGVTLDESLITSGLIKSDSVKLVNLTAPVISAKPSNCQMSVTAQDTTNAILSLDWTKYPDEKALQEVSDTKDTSLKTSSGEVIVPSTGKVLFDYSWIYGPIRYMADITVESANGTINRYSASSNDEKSTVAIGDIRDGAKIKADFYYQYEKSSITSEKETVSLNQEVSNRNITIPSVGSSLSTVQDWCNKNNVELIIKEEDTSHTAGIFSVYDSSSKEYTPGQSYEIKLTTKLTCTYYQEAKKYANLTYDKDTLYAGQSISLSINTNITNPDCTWYIDNESNCYLDNKTGQNVILTAYENAAEGTVKVTVNVIGIAEPVTKTFDVVPRNS